jgi:hypothetical protein
MHGYWIVHATHNRSSCFQLAVGCVLFYCHITYTRFLFLFNSVTSPNGRDTTTHVWSQSHIDEDMADSVLNSSSGGTGSGNGRYSLRGTSASGNRSQGKRRRPNVPTSPAAAKGYHLPAPEDAVVTSLMELSGSADASPAKQSSTHRGNGRTPLKAGKVRT